MKTVSIEELLTWAFVHELPKGGGVDGLDNMNSAWRQLEASSWGKIISFAELLTNIDQGPRDPGMWIEQGAPHEDALETGRAVAELAQCDVVIPAGWNPVSDWPDFDGLTERAVARAVERFMLRPPRSRRAHIVTLAISTAVLNRVPDWVAPIPKVKLIERDGKPAWFAKRTMTSDLGNKYEIEVDGFNRRNGRPVKDAYRKFELSHDPVGDIMGRIDYQIWVAALKQLENKLPQHLIEHRIRFGDRSMTPWLDGRDALGLQVLPVTNIAGQEKFARTR